MEERSMKKINVDDDSWMPEGWVKEEIPRSSKGKYPGYVDKKYYAPGVKKAFRSKVEALRYIEKTRNTPSPSDLGATRNKETSTLQAREKHKRQC